MAAIPKPAHSSFTITSSPNNSTQTTPPPPPPTPFQNFIAGGGSGLLTRCVVAPLDVIKVRFQLQTTRGEFYRSIPHTFYRILHEEGPRALWKGNLIATLMSSPYTAIAMTSHKTIKQKIFQSSNDSFSNAVSGGIAGIIATGLTYPCDLLRSRFIAQKGSNGYSSIYNALTTIVKNQGIKGMFEGISPALVGIVPYMAVQFAIYESLSAYLVNNSLSIGNWGKRMIEKIQKIGHKLNLELHHQDKIINIIGLDKISQSADISPISQTSTMSTVSVSTTPAGSAGSAGSDESTPLEITSPTIPSTQNTSPSLNHTQNITTSTLSREITAQTAPESTNQKETPLWVVPIVGFVSGTCGKAISFPMDLIKRRMQMSTFIYTFDQSSRPKITNNMFEVGKNIFKKEGFFAFYKGLTPALLKSGPSASLVFMFYEGILRILRAADGSLQPISRQFGSDTRGGTDDFGSNLLKTNGSNNNNKRFD